MDDSIRWIKDEIKRLKSKLGIKEERLALLKDEVAALKNELQKLKVAKEVLETRFNLPLFTKEMDAEDGASSDDDGGSGLPLPRNEQPDRPRNGRSDLAGSNIKDAAIKILSEKHSEWMDYREVADRAIQRGYQSTKSGSTDVSVTRSFLDIMRKLAELERDRTRFRLAQSNTNDRH